MAMKKYSTVAAEMLAISSLMLISAPAAARVNIDVVVGLPGGSVQLAPVYGYPQPVYVQPYPVYVAPRPLYIPQPVYVQPHPVYLEGRRSHHWKNRHHGNRGHRHSHGYYGY
jgi:hypothetical protein